MESIIYMESIIEVSENTTKPSVKANDIEKYIGRKLAEAEEDGGITMFNLQEIAYSVGVKNLETIVAENELVRAIQVANCHVPCFQSSVSSTCWREDCIWRRECKKLIAEWCR
jgi:hypothetical protein